MTQTITRLYASRDQADTAVAELRRFGFRDADIHVVYPPDHGPDEAGASSDAIADSIMKGYVLRSDAKIHAEQVRQGATLLTVHAPFGMGQRALKVMHKFNPARSGVPEPPYEPYELDEATPLSSMFGWRVISSDPTPFSNFWRWPTLVQGGGTSSRKLQQSDLPDHPAPFSSMLGLRLLSDEPAPFSGKIGAKLLSDDPAPLSTMLKMPVLTKNQ